MCAIIEVACRCELRQAVSIHWWHNQCPSSLFAAHIVQQCSWPCVAHTQFSNVDNLIVKCAGGQIWYPSSPASTGSFPVGCTHAVLIGVQIPQWRWQVCWLRAFPSSVYFPGQGNSPEIHTDEYPFQLPMCCGGSDSTISTTTLCACYPSLQLCQQFLT